MSDFIKQSASESGSWLQEAVQRHFSSKIEVEFDETNVVSSGQQEGSNSV
jgi:hypothetical protein